VRWRTTSASQGPGLRRKLWGLAAACFPKSTFYLDGSGGTTGCGEGTSQARAVWSHGCRWVEVGTGDVKASHALCETVSCSVPVPPGVVSHETYHGVRVRARDRWWL